MLCISEGRKQKDRAIRDTHERRLLRDLDKLRTRIGAGRLAGQLNIGEAIGRLKERYPRVARYYDIAFDSDAQALRYSLNEPRRQLAERLDGSYVLKSDRTDLGAEEAWRIYHLLTRAELRTCGTSRSSCRRSRPTRPRRLPRRPRLRLAALAAHRCSRRRAARRTLARVPEPEPPAPPPDQGRATVVNLEVVRLRLMRKAVESGPSVPPGPTFPDPARRPRRSRPRASA